MKNKILFIFIFLVQFQNAFAQLEINFTGKKNLIIDKTIFLVDSSKQMPFWEVKGLLKDGKGFQGRLDLDYGPYPIWVKMELINKSEDPNLMGVFENPLIDSVDFFLDTDSLKSSFHGYLGEGFSSRVHKGTFQKFPLYAPPGIKTNFYFRVRSTEQLLIPLSVSTEADALQSENQRDLVYGAFIGVVLVMLFYNLFVFMSTRDTNYLYYVVYIFFIGLGQIALSGHLFSLVLGNYPLLYKKFIVVLPAFSGIFAVLFIKHFLQAKLYEPKIDKALSIVGSIYGLAALARIFGMDHLSARMMDATGLPGATLVFYLAFRVYKKGLKSAIYFIAAWSIFIIGVVMFVFRNLSLVPFNSLTTYTLPFGASIEVALLSFALADKINTLQTQKREKEREALLVALENEKLIKEQNVVLEQKVKERTFDLAKSNEQLSETLYDLKSTQSQLVEQEKMASLGQLTAGIAHEINNPINFVTSNISPLKRDIGMIQDLIVNLENLYLAENNGIEKSKVIADLKNEIDYDYLKEEISFLLRGIDEGANRTAEIVKGLRVFSSNDENSILNTDIVEGLESTLVILNNQLAKINVVKDYEGKIFIDCFPGKLNQVFLNLLTNSIHAIDAKFKGEQGGEIKINVKIENDLVYLSFCDNGIGMSEEVQLKVFEPFFTTKPVGDGTGLGMSIVFKTIENHKGKITLNSEEGVGTCFEIKLNRTLNI